MSETRDERADENARPKRTQPGRQIIEFGVVLDDQESIDTYSTYDEAADAFRRLGGLGLVHIVTTIAAYTLPDPLTNEEVGRG